MKRLLILVTVLMLIVGGTLAVSAAVDSGSTASGSSTATVKANFTCELTSVTNPSITLDTATELNGGANLDMDTPASIELAANGDWELSVAIADGATFSNTISTDAPTGVALADVLRVNGTGGALITSSGIVITTGSATDSQTIAPDYRLDLSQSENYGNEFWNEFTEEVDHSATLTYTISQLNP